MAITILPLLAVEILLAKMLQLDAAGNLRTVFNLSIGCFGMWILVAACLYCRWREMTSMGDLAEVLAWVLLVAPAISFMIPIAGRSPYPLVDGALSRIDSAMHFQTVAVVRMMSHLPLLRHALAIVYALLWVLVFASLVIPPLCGRALDSRRFLFAVLFAAILTSALFAFWPAVGPWMVQGFSPNREQAEVISALKAMKSGKPLAEGVKSAVVAFPSFHVVLALLSVTALWNVRHVRWFALVIGVMVCISTVTTGWHYGIDVVGGFGVTHVAYFLAVIVTKDRRSESTAPISSPVKSEILA